MMLNNEKDRNVFLLINVSGYLLKLFTARMCGVVSLFHV